MISARYQPLGQMPHCIRLPDVHPSAKNVPRHGKNTGHLRHAQPPTIKAIRLFQSFLPDRAHACAF